MDSINSLEASLAGEGKEKSMRTILNSIIDFISKTKGSKKKEPALMILKYIYDKKDNRQIFVSSLLKVVEHEGQDSNVEMAVSNLLMYLSETMLSNFKAILFSKYNEQPKKLIEEEEECEMGHLKISKEQVERIVDFITPLFSFLPFLLQVVEKKSKIQGFKKLPTKLTVACSDCFLSITSGISLALSSLKEQTEIESKFLFKLFENVEKLERLVNEILIVKNKKKDYTF